MKQIKISCARLFKKALNRIIAFLLLSYVCVPFFYAQGFTKRKQLAVGVHSIALCKSQTLMAWGDNTQGEVGDNTLTQRNSPVNVSTLTGVTDVAAGNRFSLALKSDSTVWAWGSNSSGNLGDGTTTRRRTPVKVNTLTSVIDIAAAWGTSFALKKDGTVWAWGGNIDGTVGDGTTTNRLSPVQVSGLTGITAISGGLQSGYALKNDSTVWAWGDNFFGGLGDGTTTTRLTPVQVSGLTSVIAISGGDACGFAIKKDGTLWGWGHNYQGKLGDGTTTDRLTPVQVSGLTSVVAVAGLYTHALALKSDSTLWAWGGNSDGEIGDGTTTDRLTPVQVSSLTGVCAIANGSVGWVSLVLKKSDASVWAWGPNSFGTLGDGTTTKRLSPVKISGGSLCEIEILPIELLNFSGTCKNGKTNLSWATATEINNDYFTIESSSDGVNWEIVGTVQGAGHSSAIRNYTFIDKSEISGSQEVFYYRLKQTDYDGKYEYFTPIAVNCSGENDSPVFSVFPNPANGSSSYIRLKGFRSDETVLVVLLDMYGQTVYSKVTITDSNGTAIEAIDNLNRLAKSVYLITGTTRNKIYNQKLVVQ